MSLIRSIMSTVHKRRSVVVTIPLTLTFNGMTDEERMSLANVFRRVNRLGKS